MEHDTDHNTNQDRPEELHIISLDPVAAPEGVPKRRFITVLVLAVLLALACGGLVFFHACQKYEDDIQLEMMRDLYQQSERSLAEVRDELAQKQEALAEAQDTIDFLEEYSVASPDGTVPEYTQLYPDMYVPEWTGETVTGGNVCCLTFDDGPSANTDRVLAILDQYGIKATFFVVGSASTSAASQERLKKIADAGHTIGMHSWSHSYKDVYASVDAFLEEFNHLYNWIYEVTGVHPSVYRFPGGSINGYDRGVYQEIIAEMTRRGFVYYDWNASAQDATVTPRLASDIAADCLKGIGRDLVVVLCHDSGARSTTVDALPAVIEGYREAGYTFSALHPGVAPVTFGYPAMR